MRTVKFIVGIGCFILALNMGLVVYADFSAFSRINLPLTICTLGFGGVGWFLITRRHLPMSRKAKILVVPIICLLAGFVFLAVIPSIIAGLYARSQNACVNNLRRIDGAKQVWALEKQEKFQRHSNQRRHCCLFERRQTSHLSLRWHIHYWSRRRRPKMSPSAIQLGQIVMFCLML